VSNIVLLCAMAFLKSLSANTMFSIISPLLSTLDLMPTDLDIFILTVLFKHEKKFPNSPKLNISKIAHMGTGLSLS